MLQPNVSASISSVAIANTLPAFTKAAQEALAQMNIDYIIKREKLRKNSSIIQVHISR
jgi:hypothetical protein